jgi:hypothetical protein
LAGWHIGHHHRTSTHTSLIAHFHTGYQHSTGAHKGIGAHASPYPNLRTATELRIVAYGSLAFDYGIRTHQDAIAQLGSGGYYCIRTQIVAVP